jgi:hypothetical protein
MNSSSQRGILALAATLVFAAGCGSPGSPQPPSLNLPDQVLNLAAARSGNTVTLTWTMPRRNTDKLLLKGPLAVHLCRRPLNGGCQTIADLSFDPGAEASFRETLPPELTVGPARMLTYFVEVRNRSGRSVGFSNEAYSAAGAAPPPIANLTATPQSNGVLFRWQQNNINTESKLRLHRTLVQKEASANPRNNGSDFNSKEPAETELIAPIANKPQALDASALPDRIYSYTAEFLDRLTLDGNPVDLAGLTSQPIRVDTRDVFPPNPPEGLVAIANNTERSLDLSWTPNTEPDLAGYFVYRSRNGEKWQRVSGDKPLPGPAWRDLAPPAGEVKYAVSAIDFSGNESARSAGISAELQ